MTGWTNGTPVSRRDAVAGLAAGAITASSGCVQRLRSVAGWRSDGQVSLDIKTIPPDEDPYANAIARELEAWLQEAGIDAGIVLEDEEELLRSVLLNHDFDVFVARTGHGYVSPDALYSLLHSKFVAKPGWQNPFGYGDFDVDELLETQRRADGPERREAVAELQRSIARTQPFSVVCFPDAIRAGRNDRYDNWRRSALVSAEGYLALERTPGNDDGELRLVTTDRRATENLNPLAVEFRGHGVFIGLLYDSIARVSAEHSVEPWLAESWSLSERGGAPAVTVRLRDDLVWHDGEPLTAEDVVFTYEFLADTSLGDVDDPIPAPRFQGRSGLVTDVNVVDRRTVDVEFVESSAAVALSALTVPLLPAHVWTERTAPASFSGIEIDGATEALVSANVPPVGSGPLRYVESTPNERLVMERFADHFLHRGDRVDLPQDIANGVAFDRLVLNVIGSDVAAVDRVVSGEMDATASEVGADTVPRIGREDDLDLLVDRSDAFYLVGYNARRSPLSVPSVRNVLGRLIDKAAIVDEVFDDYAAPAASPLARTDWIPSDLEWEDADPATPFLGSDGELDVGAAREAFREAGYRYHDGKLQSR